MKKVFLMLVVLVLSLLLVLPTVLADTLEVNDFDEVAGQYVQLFNESNKGVNAIGTTYTANNGTVYTFAYSKQEHTTLLNQFAVLSDDVVPVPENMGNLSNLIGFLLDNTMGIVTHYPERDMLDLERLQQENLSFNLNIAHPDIWLTTKSDTFTGVIAPFYLFDTSSSDLVPPPLDDRFYILLMTASKENGTQIFVFNDTDIVSDFVNRVEIPATMSLDFNNYLNNWKIENAVVEKSIYWDPNYTPDSSVKVKVDTATVHLSDNSESKILANVKKDEVYPFYFTSENGWHCIVLEDGVLGFILPNKVKWN